MFNPEDRGDMFLQNIGRLSVEYSVISQMAEHSTTTAAITKKHIYSALFQKFAQHSSFFLVVGHEAK
jgi:hypothetical protein